MINEEKLTKYYSNLAEKLNEMIPCEWDNVYMYGEVLEDSREVYFYFKPAGEDEFVYGHDIPSKYDVDRKLSRELMRALRVLVGELHNEFVNSGDTAWTSITFSLEHTGKFKADFGYEDVLNSPFTSGERQIIWEYEVLGLEPAEEYQELVKGYLKNRKEIKIYDI